MRGWGEKLTKKNLKGSRKQILAGLAGELSVEHINKCKEILINMITKQLRILY